MPKRLLKATVVLGLCGIAFGQAKTPAIAAKPQSKQAATKKPIDPAEQRRSVTFNILGEAHDAAQELGPEQKIEILKEICDDAFWLGDYQFVGGGTKTGALVKQERFDSVDQKTTLKSWSEELYQAADELPQGSYKKLEAQASAARIMVPVDDRRALEMMDGLDASDERGAQEQKNYLGIYVFSAMVEAHGESVVPDLKARAQSMGETGQYPFGAMTVVISKIENKELARSIFNDALANFERSNDKLNSMFGLLSMIRGEGTRSKLQPWQVHEGATQIANQLKAEVDREHRAGQDGQAGRPGLGLIVNSVRDGLKEVDPELAATVPAMPAQRVTHTMAMAQDDTPAEAPSAAAKKLQSDFEKTSASLMEMSENEVHAGNELRLVIEKGVGQSVEMLQAFTENAKDHASALTNAMPPVTDFVQVGARTNPAMTLAAVRKVQDAEIRAKMLLAIAGGLPGPRD